MKKRTGITASINHTVGALFISQILFSAGVLFFYRISPTNTGVVTFVLATTAIHVGLWIFLSIMHEHFVLIHTGEKLARINFANVLTLVRISSIPTAALLLVLVQYHPVLPVLLPLIAVIFLTDLFDGAVARGTRQITRIGKYLDSISDYAVLIVVSVAMAVYSMIPDWFFILILFRLLFQLVGMGALLLYQGYLHPSASLLGKASIFATMTLYGFEVLALAKGLQSVLLPAANLLEYIAAAIVCLSLAEKVFHLKKGFVEAKETVKKQAASRQRPPID